MDAVLLGMPSLHTSCRSFLEQASALSPIQFFAEGKQRGQLRRSPVAGKEMAFYRLHTTF